MNSARLYRWANSLRIKELRSSPPVAISAHDLIWALGSFCALHRKPFDPALIVQQYPPPHRTDALIVAARALGFRVRQKLVRPAA
ncbi:MAG TPA: hypothetical protein VLV86_16645, partial [Vicinamibacterales bacterium]|nr:hypothetical protein [Vicinamibacterales bacterium]